MNSGKKVESIELPDEIRSINFSKGGQRVVETDEYIAFSLRGVNGDIHAYWKCKNTADIHPVNNACDVQDILDDYSQQYEVISKNYDSISIEGLYCRLGILNPLLRNINHMYDTLKEARALGQDGIGDSIAVFRNEAADLKRGFHLLRGAIDIQMNYLFSVRQDRLNAIQSMAFLMILTASIFSMNFSTSGVLGYIQDPLQYPILTVFFIICVAVGFLLLSIIRKPPKSLSEIVKEGR